MFDLITMDHCYTCITFLLDVVVLTLVISSNSCSSSPLSATPAQDVLPTSEDYQAIRNLSIIVCKIITQYIKSLSIFCKAIPPHILHEYSKDIGTKSEVIVLDVLMKNEAKQ